MKTIITIMLAFIVSAASAQKSKAIKTIKNATVTITDGTYIDDDGVVVYVGHAKPVAKKKATAKPSRAKAPYHDVVAVNADNKKQDTGKVAAKPAAPDSVKLSLDEYKAIASVFQRAMEDVKPAAVMRAMEQEQSIGQLAGIIFNEKRIPGQPKATTPSSPARRPAPAVATPKTDSLNNKPAAIK